MLRYDVHDVQARNGAPAVGDRFPRDRDGLVRREDVEAVVGPEPGVPARLALGSGDLEPELYRGDVGRNLELLHPRVRPVEYESISAATAQQAPRGFVSAGMHPHMDNDLVGQLGLW